VRKWCRLFVEGSINVHEWERRGPLALVTEELKENVNSEVPDGRLFRFSAPHEKFSRCDSIPDTWKFCGLAEKLGGGIYIYIYFRRRHTKAGPKIRLTYSMQHSPS